MQNPGFKKCLVGIVLTAPLLSCGGGGGGKKSGPGPVPGPVDPPAPVTCEGDELRMTVPAEPWLLASSQQIMDFAVCSSQELHTNLEKLAGGHLSASLVGDSCQGEVQVDGLRITMRTPLVNEASCVLKVNFFYQGQTLTHDYNFRIQGRPGPAIDTALAVSLREEQPHQYTLTLKAPAAAQIFAAEHTDHALMQNMFLAAQNLNVTMQENPSFELNERSWLVTVPKVEKRRPKAQHSFSNFLTSLKQLADDIRALDRTQPNWWSQPQWEAKLPSFHATVGDGLEPIYWNAIPLCLMSLLDAHEVPTRFSGTSERKGMIQAVCSDAMNQGKVTESAKVLQFGFRPSFEGQTGTPFSTLSNVACDTIRRNPEGSLADLTVWGVDATSSSDDRLFEADQQCRKHFMRVILPRLADALTAAQADYTLNQFPRNKVLASILSEATEPSPEVMDPLELLQSRVLVKLVDADLQTLPPFDPGAFNFKKARDVLQQTQGSWSRTGDLFQALLDVPDFSTALSQVESDLRLRVLQKVGSLYLLECSRDQAITMQCLNQSAAAISLYKVTGLTRSEPWGIASLKLGS